MTSGPVMIQVLEGDNAIAKNRELMGATDPKKAAPGTIRADFAQSIDANAVHGSDAPETAASRNRVLLPGSRRLSPLTSARTQRARRADDQPARPRSRRRSRSASPSAARSRFARRQVLRWIHQRFATDFDAMTDLAKALRDDARRDAPRSRARGDRATRPRPTARASGCSTWAAATRSRRCSSPRTIAARCASRRRPAARSTARSARPASRASTAT